MKATSIFGGVQVFNIAIAIIRSKAIAVLLGPAGMGVVGLLTSTIGLISSLTNFGLGTSAVRDIAEAHTDNDEQRMAKTAAVFRKLVWITGGLGTILTIILAPLLSMLTFGNSDYTWTFVVLSVTLLLGQFTAAQNVLLQGTRKLKYLAYANMLGSISSLFIALPLYFIYGQDGIVPAIIMMGFGAYLIAINFSRNVKIKKVSVNLQEAISEGKGMLKLGFMLSLSGLISTIASYLINIYIRNYGNIEDVGLYNAGFQIIGTYVGLVFTAMATDYYPRLSGVANDNDKRNTLVNQQGEIAILILLPIILVFMVFIPYIVELLYSSKFLPITDMIIWAAYAMFFKAGSWAIAFQFLAKGSSRLFFINELVVTLYLLLFNLMGYHYFGLTGLGYAFILAYLVYIVQVYALCKYHYAFNLDKGSVKTFAIAIIACSLCLWVVLSIEALFKYIIGSSLVAAASAYSVYQLNAKTGILTKMKWKKL